MWGLGDSIYARPFIASQAGRREVFLETPWPELYSDLPLKFVRGERELRTQTRNVLRQPASTWTPWPIGVDQVAISYGHADLLKGSVVQGIERKLPLSRQGPEPVWNLPRMGNSPIDTGGAPLAIIRPVTRRREWDNQARNAWALYVDMIAADLKKRGYAVVVIADLAPGHEWLESGQLPPHNAAFTRGEFSIKQTLATVRDAAVVVGPVGWIVPAAIALNVPAFIVLGGMGGHNAPEKLTDPRMALEKIGWAMPTEFCLCSQMDHACDKAIPDLMAQWATWQRSVNLADRPSSRISKRNSYNGSKK